MLKRLVPALCLVLLAAPAWPQSQAEAAGVAPQPSTPATADAPDSVAEKVIVPGQRPGPGLWKISKGEHVLWVFGLYAPLPKGLTWRSHQVEAILAQSQEYLLSPSISAQVGFFRALTLLPFAIGAKKNPDGAQLRELLSADVYARWQALKAKYIGNDDGIERERPVFVSEQLFRRGLAVAGLTSGQEVREAIDQMVKKNKIKVTPSHIELAFDDPAKLLKEFKKTPLDDIACFAKTLERLETDLDAMRVRANAWATGNVAVIEALSYADRGDACAGVLFNSAFMNPQPGLPSMEQRMRATWLATAEKSLATNASTFATLQMKDILEPGGYVAALAAKGYLVEKPD